jgi:hypothetical protein
MLRKILLVSCALSFTLPAAFGQKKDKAKAAATTTADSKINYKEVGAPLPALKIYTKEGKYLYDRDLANEANLIIMLFNPTCEHCEDQARSFKENISLFKKSKIVLVAAANMGPYLSYFTNNTKLDSTPQLQVGIDSSQYIDKTFTYESLPQINIYNKERKLIKTYNGPVAIESLKDFIE